MRNRAREATVGALRGSALPVLELGVVIATRGFPQPTAQGSAGRLPGGDDGAFTASLIVVGFESALLRP
jgi:hypothetical protein